MPPLEPPNPTDMPTATQPPAPDPARPGTFARRVLVVLAGLSPQVVTETLYALLTQADPFRPTELRVVTTEIGRARLLPLLQHPERGLAALWAQHGQGPAPAFDVRASVHVIHDDEQALDDLTDAGHHVSTADAILDVLRPLVLDREGCAVHASLAGGRKSMSFYMGYVMSLLARPQDRLSHVLVNEPFERLHDFSFPPREPVDLQAPDGRRVSTTEARIRLVPVPFVHLFDRLPDRLLASRVSFQSLIDQTELALARPSVVLDLPRRSIGVAAPGHRSLAITLAPQEMALYAYLAKVRQRDGADGGLVAFPTRKGETDLSHLDDGLLRAVAQPLDLSLAQLRESWRYAPQRNEHFSHIKDKLAAALNESLRIQLRVWGPTERGSRRDGLYGLLGLAPGQIHFGNLPGA